MAALGGGRAPVDGGREVGSLEGGWVEEIDGSADTVAESEGVDIANLFGEFDGKGHKVVFTNGDELDGEGKLVGFGRGVDVHGDELLGFLHARGRDGCEKIDEFFGVVTL